jgi:hypothetical protein
MKAPDACSPYAGAPFGVKFTAMLRSVWLFRIRISGVLENLFHPIADAIGVGKVHHGAFLKDVFTFPWKLVPDLVGQ